MAPASPASAKLILRAEMRVRRRALAAEHPDAAEQAAARLPLESLPPFEVVAGYVRHGAEISPAAVLARLQTAGAGIALPVTVAADEPLVFRAASPEHEHVADAAGVRAPPDDAEELVPDLLIVPLVAFDRNGGRLGQGGGHFDRTLEALDAKRRVFAIGLAYAGQEVAAVPAEEHDRRLDAILTEKEYIAVQRDEA
jgi:5-formyltetrahydrofolate cyclo-ligase